MFDGVRMTGQQSREAQVVPRKQGKGSTSTQGRTDEGNDKERTVKRAWHYSDIPARRRGGTKSTSRARRSENLQRQIQDRARRAEQARRREMEEGYHGLKKRAAPRLFGAVAQEWLMLKKPTLAARS